jgi:import inner membrane translocase subunit TIM44
MSVNLIPGNKVYRPVVGTTVQFFSTKRDEGEETVDEAKGKEDGEEAKEVEGGEEKKEEESGFKMPEMKIPQPREVVSKVYGGFLDLVDWSKEQITLGMQELRQDPSVAKKDVMTTKLSEDFNFAAAKAEEEENEEGEEKPVYDGPTAVVHVKEQGTAWDQMKERLSHSPIYQALRKQGRTVSKVVGSTAVGKVGKQGVDAVSDKMEDAREYWETSQNPLVYAAAGAIENITGETEEALAVKEIWKVIPGFDTDEFVRRMEKELAPRLIKAHLRGDIEFFKDQLGEGVYHKLTADIDAREKDGLYLDPNVLDFEQQESQLRILDGFGPVIMCTYRVQQIHCVRDVDGELVDGSETDVRAKFYHMVYTVHRCAGDPKLGEEEHSTYAKWKVAEYGFFGDVPYY